MGKTQEEPRFISSLKAGKDPSPSSEAAVPLSSALRAAQGRSSALLVRGSAFVGYSDLQLMRRGPPTLGRATCFTQSINLKL